ncbi:MAG: DpnI domain-containing protein [Terracidiphilus sp.]
MELTCDISVATGYKSSAQIARVVSEAWLATNGYGLVCDADSLVRCLPNTRCTDFFCPACGQNYELKTFHKRPPASLVDGAYSALIKRIMDGTAPTLFLLQRGASWTVEALTAIHSVFLTPPVIEKRKPLSATAVRAGWVGCNIRLDRMGPDGEIQIIDHGRVVPKRDVRGQFRRFLSLSSIAPSERGWTTLTLATIRSLSRRRFYLSELYDKERIFQTSYPRNRNVRPKIRQQLQILRDLRFISFEGDGEYSLLD